MPFAQSTSRTDALLSRASTETRRILERAYETLASPFPQASPQSVLIPAVYSAPPSPLSVDCSMATEHQFYDTMFLTHIPSDTSDASHCDDHAVAPTSSTPIAPIVSGAVSDASTKACSLLPKSGRGAKTKFKCELCPSTFSRKDNLKTHQRMHSGEMPFLCRYCGRKFRWQSSARTHEQAHGRKGDALVEEYVIAASELAAGCGVNAIEIDPSTGSPSAPQKRSRAASQSPERESTKDKINAKTHSPKRPRVSKAFDNDFPTVPSAHARLPLLDLEALLASAPSTGLDVQTPMLPSPMFNLPTISQFELERCLEESNKSPRNIP